MKFKIQTSRKCFGLLKLCALAMVLSQAVTTRPALAESEIAVGVNVNAFQNFSPGEQDAIVGELSKYNVKFVRTSLRPDLKNIQLAKKLQNMGIGLVLNASIQFAKNTQPRPASEHPHLREAMPLSAADPELSKEYFQNYFDILDEQGIVLAGVELGNELNWADFNGDFPVPGQGKSFDFQDLSKDSEAKQVARGFLKYIEVLKALKQVRDGSKINKNAPIISAGMAGSTGSAWQIKNRIDGVTIAATYRFLRLHGLEDLIDGFGVHCGGLSLKSGEREEGAQRTSELNKFIFPNNISKPIWVTEWGFGSSDAPAQEQNRLNSVKFMRSYFEELRQKKRLGGIFYYVWNEPAPQSVFRRNALVESGHYAIAPMR